MDNLRILDCSKDNRPKTQPWTLPTALTKATTKPYSPLPTEAAHVRILESPVTTPSAQSTVDALNSPAATVPGKIQIIATSTNSTSTTTPKITTEQPADTIKVAEVSLPPDWGKPKTELARTERPISQQNGIFT